MTANEAKKDLAQRLKRLDIPFIKLRAKSVSFEDLARGNAIFVYVDGATFSKSVGFTRDALGIPKASDGGYSPMIGSNCNWKD